MSASWPWLGAWPCGTSLAEGVQFPASHCTMFVLWGTLGGGATWPVVGTEQLTFPGQWMLQSTPREHPTPPVTSGVCAQRSSRGALQCGQAPRDAGVRWVLIQVSALAACCGSPSLVPREDTAGLHLLTTPPSFHSRVHSLTGFGRSVERGPGGAAGTPTPQQP